MEREACVCDHGFERSDLCAEIIMDQPGKVVNPARGQLNVENEYFPVPVCAREFDLARRIQPSRPVLACPFSTLRLNLVLRGLINVFYFPLD